MMYSASVCELSEHTKTCECNDTWCRCTILNTQETQCEGMGEVGQARYEPALLPPCPSIRVSCYSNCVVSYMACVLYDADELCIAQGNMFKMLYGADQMQCK